jgi:hypothetical protein
MAGGKKIKLEEEAISEILIADTDLEASDVEDYIEEEEEEASAEVAITDTGQ